MRPASWFKCFAKATASASGHPVAFILALLVIVLWAATGPIFGFNDTWQLVINTATTIITFLMVFLIQNTQNRDTKAMQLKLDELIRVTKGAHTALLDLEELEDSELEKFRLNYEKLAVQARENLRKGIPDTEAPEVEIQKNIDRGEVSKTSNKE